MKRIETVTLEDAYKEAAREFGCSITEINYEIVQYPTTGVMGLFKKTAIIVAAKKVYPAKNSDTKVTKSSEQNENNKIKEDSIPPEKPQKVDRSEAIKKRLLKEQESDKVLDSFFEKADPTPPKQVEIKSRETVVANRFDDDRDSPANKALSSDIENKLISLMKTSCFDIDTVEVDVFNNIAHIFIDGEDAALLIGKEGYRYNALSYMLFNWINAHHGLYIKLEIAEFIQSQEEMIINYLKPIIEHVQKNGRGKTKPLDGILVQIALELLRAEFPNKYVAIKTAKDSRKFIIINDFNSRKK